MDFVDEEFPHKKTTTKAIICGLLCAILQRMHVVNKAV